MMCMKSVTSGSVESQGRAPTNMLQQRRTNRARGKFRRDCKDGVRNGDGGLLTMKTVISRVWEVEGVGDDGAEAEWARDAVRAESA